jgi:hypothetical protein
MRFFCSLLFYGSFYKRIRLFPITYIRKPIVANFRAEVNWHPKGIYTRVFEAGGLISIRFVSSQAEGPSIRGHQEILFCNGDYVFVCFGCIQSVVSLFQNLIDPVGAGGAGNTHADGDPQ